MPERLPVAGALGRALAEDVRATGSVPPFACSAMDGFALLAGPAGRDLAVVGESRAGRPSGRGLAAGEAIRVSTGAAVPAGADAVVRVEDTETADGRVSVAATTTPGQNIREPGEDLTAGALILPRGTELGAAELGVAVSAGRAELEVARRPRVAIVVTGDELVEPGRALGPGQIHNSNAYALGALAALAGGDVVSRAQARDEAEATTATLDAAMAAADVVLISGGVSVGPHDHVRRSLAVLGVEQRFWGVSLRPGKPTWFGVRGAVLVFGLPGNPVSAFVTFTLFAQPALRAAQGLAPWPERETAVLDADVEQERREQAVRVRLANRDGVIHAAATGPQGSHIMSSMLGADALAFVPGATAGSVVCKAGERVAVERLGRAPRYSASR